MTLAQLHDRMLISFEALCKELEHWETPRWAVDEILQRELLTRDVLDPCCGTGVLTDAARDHRYTVTPCDIHDWGFLGTQVCDFLSEPVIPARAFSVLMNPPFSKATEFVEQAFALGARKVLCFQRFAWWESDRRADFWRRFPPQRIYICASRATCWLHSIPAAERERTADGKRRSGSPTTHAWFVFERGHPPGTVMGHIYKTKGGRDDGEADETTD